MRTVAIWLLLMTSAMAQVTIEVKNVLSGVEGFQVVDKTVFVPETAKPAIQPVGLVTVPVEWVKDKENSAQIIVQDSNDKDIPFVTVGPDNNVFQINAEGRVKIIVVNPKPFYFNTKVLNIGKAPTPEPGPGPGPTPNPIGPPIPGLGLKVLIVYELDDLHGYIPAHRYQIQSSTFQAWVASVVGPDTAGVPMARVLDKDTTCPVNAKSMWCDALARPRSTLPWIIISNDKTGYEGPLPTTEQETRTLIERFK